MVGGWKGKVKLLGISSENAMVVDGSLFGCGSSSLFSSAIDFRGLLQLYISVAHILPFLYIFFGDLAFVLRTQKEVCLKILPLVIITKDIKRDRKEERERERDSLGIRRVLSP